MNKLALVAVALALGCGGAQPRPTPPPPPPPPRAPPPPPTGPQPMTHDEFHRLLNMVDQEAGDKAKLALVETAAASNWLTAAQAGALLEHIVYRQSKLDAVPLIKSRILDKKNEYLLIEHFTYREDKVKVQEMLLAH